ncbi:MAG TPA: hypothetical protein VIH31_02910 [Candidatus Paceibacterota bacterium]
MKPKIKNIIIFAVIFILLVVVYVVFLRPKPAPSLVGTAGTPVTASAPTSSQVGQEFLSLLLNIRSIKLDDAIFSNPAFGVLQDYTIILVPEGNEGRINPFAPIGVDTSPVEAFPFTETIPSADTDSTVNPEDGTPVI